MLPLGSAMHCRTSSSERAFAMDARTWAHSQVPHRKQQRQHLFLFFVFVCSRTPEAVEASPYYGWSLHYPGSQSIPEGRQTRSFSCAGGSSSRRGRGRVLLELRELEACPLLLETHDPLLLHSEPLALERGIADNRRLLIVLASARAAC